MRLAIWSAAGIAAAVCAFEALVLRGFTPRATEIWLKVLQMWRLRSRAPVDVVFLGTSQIMAAVDSGELGHSCGTSSFSWYNASLSLSSPSAWLDWYEMFVAPLLRPRVVVMAMAGWELNGNSPSMVATEVKLREHRMTSSFYISRLRDRHLAVVRRPGILKALVRQTVRRASDGAEPAGATLDDNGCETRYRDRQLPLTTDRMRDVLENGLLIDFEVASRQVDALRGLVERVRSDGAAAFFVYVPFSPEFSLYAGGRERSLSLAWEEVRGVATDLRVPIIELSLDFSAYEFADPIHLSGRGTKRFTKRLHNQLSDLVTPRSGDELGGKA